MALLLMESCLLSGVSHWLFCYHEIMSTIVVGLGNPILSDDGVGPRVAAELETLSGKEGISIAEANVGGLGLIDLLAGYDRAIIIDAIQTVNGKPGNIYQLDLTALGSSRHTGPVHDFDLATALKLGNLIGMVLPRRIDVFAIEAADVSTFGEECTPEVRKAIPICAEMVRRELER
jgi:hydrogenase maturation protease